MTPGQYAQGRKRLFGRTAETLGDAFEGLGSWRLDDADEFFADALPVLQGAQRSLGEMVAVRVADSKAEFEGLAPEPIDVADEFLVGLREDVTLEDELLRPFQQVWRELHDDVPLSMAVTRGRARLEGLADLDLQMTEASAARVSMQAAGAAWWKRVPVGEKNCLLCLVSSTKVYHVGDLKPIHPGCDCAIEEQFTPRPDGGIHDEALLKKAYAAVKDATGTVQTSGPVIRDLLADMTVVNGEVGPMLAYPRGVKRPAA